MKALILAFALVGAVPASAVEPELPVAAVQAEKSARLDALFVELQKSKDVTSGKITERAILLEWLKSGDDAVDALMRAALIAMDARAFDAALTLLDEIVDEKPDFAEGWNKRATVYFLVDQYDRSLADIQRTLELEPRHFGALAGLGMIMNNLGRTQNAITAFERAVAVNPPLDNLRQVIEDLRAKISKDI